MSAEAEPTEAAQIIAIVKSDPEVHARICAWLDAHGIKHSGHPSAATLGAVTANDARTWRKWASGETPCDETAMRLIREVAGLKP